MNLVFIHGRAQGDSSEQAIRDYWKAGMQRGFAAAGVAPRKLDQIIVPFYGQRLDALTVEARLKLVRVVERGEAQTQEPFDDFAATFIERVAERAGVSRDQAMDEAGLTVVERGPENWAWVQALLQAAERRSPWLANFSIAKITADVQTYLSRPYVRQEIDNIVLPALRQDPCVVVAHSLGSVVAYWLLAENPQINVPLFVTAGSPLGLGVIKDRLPHPLHIPGGVQKWLNVSDERDVVALYARLDRDSFLEGIENLSDVHNGDNPHDIARYFEDTTLARRIAAALS
jgi:pimeloyl-ACP methyl ester carboxylesterase